ncbi:class I SAM-dependent methyltransferase [bacterium]|nr:class I SAM-dependent methyltransferase [bacterium]
MIKKSGNDLIAYLDAKEAIDQRSRNPQVWASLLEQLAKRSQYASGLHLNVTEIGGGLGGLAKSLLEACTNTPLNYTLFDIDPDVVAEAEKRLDPSASTPHKVSVIEGDLLDYELNEKIAPADLVVVQSALDLFDLRDALPRVRAFAKPNALLYAPVTFNGFTEFRPPYQDSQFEYRLLAEYHRSMDERTGIHPDAGGSRAGWVLERSLRRMGSDFIETNSSDWLVSSDPKDGPNRTFIEHILRFFEGSLSTRMELDQQKLGRWLELRRRQLADGHLLLHIHNLDLLAAFPG